MPEITNEDLFEAVGLIYRRWAEEYDLLKKVKAEKPDYKLEPDWDQMHQIRLKNHTAEEAKWKQLLDRLAAKLPKLSAQP